MKRIWITIAPIVIAIGCTKVKPDWDQVQCDRIRYMKQMFADSSGFMSHRALTDSTAVVDRMECGEEYQKAVHYGSCKEQLCDLDGIKYWIRYWTIIGG